MSRCRHLSIYLSIYPSVRASVGRSVGPSAGLPACLHIPISISKPVPVSVDVSISLYLSTHVSIYLSVYVVSNYLYTFKNIPTTVSLTVCNYTLNILELCLYHLYSYLYLLFVSVSASISASTRFVWPMFSRVFICNGTKAVATMSVHVCAHLGIHVLVNFINWYSTLWEPCASSSKPATFFEIEP